VEWVRRDAIHILTISDHVARLLRRNFRALAESKDQYLHSAGYEYVKVDVFVPLLDLPQTRNHTSSALSHVAVQGNINFDRRDYLGIYADLLVSFKEDPRAWGYLPITGRNPAHEVDETSPLRPFQLHLIGYGDVDPQIPPALSNVIRVHANLDYDKFFLLIQSMDLVLPAFATEQYYEIKASSTMPMSLECNVPILVSQWMRESYSFLDDDRVTVTRPQVVREIFAIKALRTGQWSPRPALDHHAKEVMMDVNKMIQKGWIRSTDEFTKFKQEIWARNSNIIRRILNSA